MPRDLTVVLQDRPGTVADAAQALGRAGVNIEGACGFVSSGEGILHLLVDDAAKARRAMEEAGLEVREDREVIVLDRLPDQPGSLGDALRRIADAGGNLNLIYNGQDGSVVLGGDDAEALRNAAGGAGA